jgi:hypothetical protein
MCASSEGPLEHMINVQMKGPLKHMINVQICTHVTRAGQGSSRHSRLPSRSCSDAISGWNDLYSSAVGSTWTHTTSIK